MNATLTYHSIDDSGSPISVPPAVVEAHIHWLGSGRVAVVPLDELVGQPGRAGDAVALTFDDGFTNTRWVLERLIERGMIPTVFVATANVGGTNAWGGRPQPGIPTLPLFNWPDLERLVRLGVRVETHSRTHPRLSSLSAAQLDDELEGSRDELRRRLGGAGSHIAYPYGDVDERVADRAGQIFSFGHTTEMSRLSVGLPPLRLPRLDMYYYRSQGALEAWGRPSFWRRVAWIRTRRRIRALMRP